MSIFTVGGISSFRHSIHEVVNLKDVLGLVEASGDNIEKVVARPVVDDGEAAIVEDVHPALSGAETCE